MPDGGQGAQWQIDILAADKSAAAFASFDRRVGASAQTLKRLAQDSMAAASRQADGFAKLAAAQPSAQAAGYARLAAATARVDSSINVARLADQSAAALAAMYGVGVTGATNLAKANERAVQAIGKLKGGAGAGDRSSTGGGIGAAPRDIDRTDAGIVGLTRNLKQLAVAYGVVQAVSYAWNVGMRSGALIDQSAQLGVTTTQLQAYRLAAAQAGVDSGSFDTALQKLTGQMGAAKGGSDEAIEKFEKLGVKLLDAQGNLRSVSDILPEAARGLLKISSETERNAIAQELFGKSGSRVVTMLTALAQGNDALTAAARAQNAVIEKETLEAWNKLDAQLKVTKAAGDAALATLGAPIATWALEQVNKILTDINANLARLKQEQQTIRGRAAEVDSKHLEERLAALRQNPTQFGFKASEKALMDQLAAARAEQQAQQAADAAGLFVGDTPQYVAPGPAGKSNPTGNKAGAAGQKLDVRLKELQTERKALDQALSAFEVRGNETVAEADRRIDAQVKLNQKIFDVLKDVPPNSPLAQQLIQEATAVSQLTQRLEEKKRLLGEAEQITRQYGDGTRDLARTIELYNKLLAMGAINQGTYNAALKAATQQADDAARAYRGAQGGFDGFMAGFEQGMADMERANTAFELGRRMVDDLSKAFTDLAIGAEVDFGKILLSFMSMFAQMEMRAMASNIWNMISGKGPTDQGIGGMLSNFFSGLGGGGGGDFFSAGPIAVDGIPTIALADGGDYRAGVPRLVGEDGWELDVPRGSGTIYNQDQLRSMLGGGDGGAPVINIYNTNQFGSVVSRAEMDDAIRRNSEGQREAVTAGMLDAKTRGGRTRTTWKR